MEKKQDGKLMISLELYVIHNCTQAVSNTNWKNKLACMKQTILGADNSADVILMSLSK